MCGADSARIKLVKAGVPIHECRRCGLAYWTPAVGFRPEDTYDAAYFEDPAADRGYDDYAGQQASLAHTFQRRLARLPAPGPGGRLLDIGAAFGFGVAAAQRAGWRAVGIELAGAAARRASEQTGGAVALASATAAPFADGSFDLLTLWDVIEHLPDPHAAAAECARLLRPGGTLALTTGDVGSWLARLSGSRWHLYTLPEHLFFFSRDSLRALLEAHSFHVEEIRAESAYYSLGYLLERLRKTLLGRSGRGRADWPGAGLALPVNLFDVVTVRATRGGTSS